jgi:hypothetical protein
MVSEGQRHRAFHCDLHRRRQRREAGGEGGTVQSLVQAQDWGGRVGEEIRVDQAGEGHARDAVQRGTIPGQLRLVDTEVRSEGSVLALGVEDGSFLGGAGGGLGGCRCEA